MAAIVELAVAAVTGGGGTLVGQSVLGWLKSRGEVHRADRDADARLDEHRDRLTFDLLDAAREDIAALRGELTQLRPNSGAMAHLDEALDHLHALLRSEGEAELRAAERRANAFLRRMRPEIGDLRNHAQAATSAQRVMRDIEGSPEG